QNLKGQLKDIDKKNDYGGSVGGPVWIPKLYRGRDKTFFFFFWEQYRQKQGSTATSSVLTDQERAGDFSFLLVPSNVIGTNLCDGTPIVQGQIFDFSMTKTVMVGGQPVQCRTAFPGNKITNFSTVAQNILKFVPEPTSSNKNQLLPNFFFTTVNPI